MPLILSAEEERLTAGGQPRDKSGRFGSLPEKPKKPKTMEQKNRDLSTSRVSKWKAAAIQKMDKIQTEM